MPEHQPSTILRASRIGKVYHVLPRLRALIAPRAGQARGGVGRVAALDEISLSLAEGEAVAIIGANGAGKSTFLRILSGLSRPTSGTLECGARVGTLLDLGAGLIDEWSGESNAASALALQGERSERIDEIARFAELGSYFARPVRTYSTGMRLRLAYALAMGLSPRILVADEIVAVGDESFQRRCALELQRFLSGGGTLVLATHSLYLAEKLCQRALWLERGRLRQLGATREVTAAYRDSVLARAQPHGSRPSTPLATEDVSSRRGAGAALLRVEAGAEEGGSNVVTTGSPWRLRIENGASAHPARQWIDIRRADGTLISRLHPRHGMVDFSRCRLLPGRFLLELCERSESTSAGTVRAREMLLVRGARRELGSVLLEHEWR